ncbi:hypothetical protein Fcan01_08688 [Folsomia candida]|uniref:Cytochrome b561 domain-containing protein n=1 Tax=Folsomia candida TaxID=158441 RepID=A0A226EEY2_FOLCA|nr:hypothetical protein Fcan01_08688 [Folsomia candida]
MHGPAFYENADPVPRGVHNVICSEPLKGEWIMNPDPTNFTWPGTKTKHRASITAGADLVLNPNATADSTFGGAIKFIYPAPSRSSLYNLHPPWYTNSTEYSTRGDAIRQAFGGRRTWTYSDRPMKDPSGMLDIISESSAWKLWDDWYEYPRGTDVTLQTSHSHYHSAVQRVLNEFDWETWREQGPGHGRCSVYGGPAYMLNNYPHPYYDATCVQLMAQHPGHDQYWEQNTNARATFRDPTTKMAVVVVGDRYKLDWSWVGKTSFTSKLPPIKGRCTPSIWFVNGMGFARDRPPVCDLYFRQYETRRTLGEYLFRLDNEMYLTNVTLGNRTTWREKYVTHTRKNIILDNRVCEALKELHPSGFQCPSLLPRPYTPQPELSPTEAAILQRRKERYKLSNAYKRGMMAAEDPFTLFIWDSRLLHGIFMTIIVIFVTPVSFFLTRYFKETFMNNRIFLHRIWFFVHMSSAFVTLLLLLLGMWRQVGSKALLGVSLRPSATAHRIMGWFSIVISILLLLLGGFRPLEKQLRAVTIILHGVMGLAFYVMCRQESNICDLSLVACVLTANAIPGSPAAHNDFAVLAFFGKNLTTEPIFITVTGRFARIYMLTAYVVMALACTVTICTFMLKNSPRGKGLGHMSCTHEGPDNDRKMTPLSAVGFLLLLTAEQVGKVSPQLYTYLEDVAAVWDLPLENVNPSFKHYKKEGRDLQFIINEIRYVTCLPKIPKNLGQYNFNPQYFCANVPNPRIPHGDDNEYAWPRPWHTKEAGHRTPHSQFWLSEPRAWVGGIGQFVQDFPRCEELGYNSTMGHVTQQYMPCGSVQGGEATYGNNFYYTRTKNEDKYGKTYTNSANETEIHLNFKLDNSFCNMYYDLDFIANGVAIDNHKNAWTDPPFSPNGVNMGHVSAIQRSVSTRFVFTSSHPMHGPIFYENADPVPRGVENVTCNASLQGEWIMNPNSANFTWPGTKTKHRASITTGADLVLNPNATADSTFGGAIKFIYPAPSRTDLSDLHPPWYTNATEYSTRNDSIRQAFGGRRTWTYSNGVTRDPQDVFYKGPRPPLVPSDWKLWDDWYEYPRGRDPTLLMSHSHYHSAVQRVLNEFDWETWRERADDRNPGYSPWGNGVGRCSIYSISGEGINHYPHPYYDATCVNVQAQHPDHEVNNVLNTNVQATFLHVYYFREWEHVKTGPVFGFQWVMEGVRMVPPFVTCISESTREAGRWQNVGNRSTWHDKYVNNGLEKNEILCRLQEEMRKAGFECPLLVPRPLTLAPNLSVEEIGILKRRKERYKLSNAYKRGMLAAEDPFTLFIWDSRLIHGIFMTIIVMFVTPVHLSLSLVTVLLSIVGLIRQVGSRAILGVSLSRSGLAHRIMGWMSVVISILLFVLGGIRPMKREFRAVTIIMHGVMGFLFYWLGLACMLTANAIPGSPAAYQDFSILSFFGHLNKEAVFLIGRFPRIYMLTAYIAVALTCTVTICTFMLKYSPRKKGLGFMSCTHSGPANDIREAYTC